MRSLAADPSDPRRLYLGTSDGHIFGSEDGGTSWRLLGRAGNRQDGVVTTIVVDPRDPRKLYASTWTRDPNQGGGGGVFFSADAGRSWRAAGLVGQSVRALAQAPSAPDTLVAGTLDGVYRSSDAAGSWQRISPLGDEEIRNVDSVTIDPRNPEIIYAGTFHLPWRTTDGGRRWAPIHSGMIDDSDVFSIVVDRANPRRVFASACSGIYRSENGGAVWQKIQGIPFSARRTHVIRQDPQHPSTVYAGTTEGLWKTTNSGATWQRHTPHDWVINALVIDPHDADRLVLGTERLGVMVSIDGGKSFRAANEGFYHRQVVAMALDREHPGRVLAVLTNAPEPALATDDGGHTWLPLGPGLHAEGLRRVYASPDGWWASLERGGFVRYWTEKGAWVRAGSVTGQLAGARDRRGRKIPSRGPRPLQAVVEDMAFSRAGSFLATPEGLLVSHDAGATWTNFPVGPLTLPVRSVRASADGKNLWVVSLRGMAFSHDAGTSWSWHDLPYEAGGALRLDVADERTLLATARAGLYISRDAAKTWQLAANGLPGAPVQDLAIVGTVFLISMQAGGLYISYDAGRNWMRVEGTLAEGYFPVVTSSDLGSVIFAASATEGLYAVEIGRRAEMAGSKGDSR